MYFFAFRILAKSSVDRKSISALLGKPYILRVGTAIFIEMVKQLQSPTPKQKFHV
jgi:hypothetical protein